MRPNYFLLLAALLGLSQCRKDPAPSPPPVNQVDLLPPATQTGRRTFGCLVDGKAWNLVGNPSRPAFTAQYSSTNRLSLTAIGTSNSIATATEDIIQLSINKLITAEQYNKSGDTCSVIYKRFTTNCTYHTTSSHVAKVVITKFDGSLGIVSGTFTFNLETPGCGEVIVTEGRFDTLF